LGAQVPTNETAQQPSSRLGFIYLYGVNVTSDADWTNLNFTGGPKVLEINASIIRGATAKDLSYVAGPGSIMITYDNGQEDRSKGTNKAFQNVTVVIQIRLLAIAGTVNGSASVSNGSGSTNVTLSLYAMGTFKPFSQLGIAGTTNTRDFTVDYSQLYGNPSDSTSFQQIPLNFKHRVFAFYYPWYGNPAGPSKQWSHWVNVTQMSIASATDYPLFGAYDSQDATIVKAQMLLAREAGIDGFISSWWGVGNFEDRSLQVVLSVAQQLNFTVSAYYETARNLTATDMVNELTYLVTQYGSNPAFLKINGHPVIFVYYVGFDNRGASFWLKVRDGLESKVGEVYLIADVGGLAQPQWLSYLNVFDGFHSYKILNSSSMNGTYSYFSTNMNVGLPGGLSWDEALNYISLSTPVSIEQKALFFTVLPGNNRTGAVRVGGGPISFVDRLGGETYARSWQFAISSNATDVLITSWNEWHEGTELEPSRQYGFSYLQFTRGWTAKYKQESTTSGGMPMIEANLSLPIAELLPGVFGTNLTLTNSGDAPAFYTNVTVTSGQNISMSGFVCRNPTPYSETESFNSYSAVIPLIMPNQSVIIGI